MLTPTTTPAGTATRPRPMPRPAIRHRAVARQPRAATSPPSTPTPVTRRARFGLVALAPPLAVAVAVTIATRVEVAPAVHEVALFVHLAALVVGFGAVLAVDWVGLLWLIRKVPLADVLATASRLSAPIWLGLSGLVASGALLSPDPTSPRTLAKLVLVAALGVNGVLVRHLHPRLIAAGDRPGRRLLARAGISTAVSQLCWWGATVIGFLNARS